MRKYMSSLILLASIAGSFASEKPLPNSQLEDPSMLRYPTINIMQRLDPYNDHTKGARELANDPDWKSAEMRMVRDPVARANQESALVYEMRDRNKGK